MKIAFDAHVPYPVAKAIRAISTERKIRRPFARTERELPEVTIVIYFDYEPQSADHDYIAKSDVPWLERFAKDGGQAIISGDSKMLRKPFELSALQRL